MCQNAVLCVNGLKKSVPQCFTTRLALSELETFARRQSYSDSSIEICFWMGRKHSGKREKMLAAKVFAKVSFKVLKSWDCLLAHYHTLPHFDTLKIYSCGKHCEKRRNCLLQAISPFLTMFFSTLCGTYFSF